MAWASGTAPSKALALPPTPPPIHPTHPQAAEQQCVSAGGHLASFRNADEWATLGGRLTSSQDFLGALGMTSDRPQGYVHIGFNDVGEGGARAAGGVALPWLGFGCATQGSARAAVPCNDLTSYWCCLLGAPCTPPPTLHSLVGFLSTKATNALAAAT